MSYQSIDSIQNALGKEIFSNRKDEKKASGRALGTIVEIITFYLLKSWGIDKYISIEKKLFEYGNSDISHNVEYSLHPVINSFKIEIDKNGVITSTKILNKLEAINKYTKPITKKINTLLTTDKVLRNACVIGETENSFLVANFEDYRNSNIINIYEHLKKVYAIFECKRVGIEEGNKKGPQTIEKAKQGAYVARTVSSLQKISTNESEKYGIIYNSKNEPIIKPYKDLIHDIIYSDNSDLLEKFILTVGVVSNHGNWFTGDNLNKELNVLNQSYDWLIFLTDEGLSSFIEDLILSPKKEYSKVKDVFHRSYLKDKKKNSFTKVQIDIEADLLLQKYFLENSSKIESWFNILTDNSKNLVQLKLELLKLSEKDWENIL